jgi:hypothetical protein
MRMEKTRLLSDMTAVTNRIADLEQQARKIKIDYQKRKDLLAEIESLTKIYDLANKTPVWPFDRALLLKFLTPQVASALSFLGVAQSFTDLLFSWFSS